jgi:lipopolysaccharide/colanic/teichoic acid biosynthesis glycosyltransferase
VKVGLFAQKPVEFSENEPCSPEQIPTSAHAPARRTGDQRLFLVESGKFDEPSAWSQSVLKRVFDCSCVLLAMPLLFPVLAVIAVAVRLTSAGPVLFLQRRVGAHGRTFTILKFRTILHNIDASYHPVTTADNQPFTPVGPLLRRWKLDELPQVFNVLMGHMSLVGPRPKMPQHVIEDLRCRPGITGAATIAFAREEAILDRVPKHYLEAYYHSVVLPTKRRLDAEYMARATCASDLKLILDSMLRRWDNSFADSLLEWDSFKINAVLNEVQGGTSQAILSHVPEDLATEAVQVGSR